MAAMRKIDLTAFMGAPSKAIPGKVGTGFPPGIAKSNNLEHGDVGGHAEKQAARQLIGRIRHHGVLRGDVNVSETAL